MTFSIKYDTGNGSLMDDFYNGEYAQDISTIEEAIRSAEHLAGIWPGVDWVVIDSAGHEVHRAVDSQEDDDDQARRGGRS